MIIQTARHIAGPSYTADPVAQDLRAAISTCAPGASRIADGLVPSGAAAAPLDLIALYPAIFTPAARPTAIARTARAIVFRLTVYAATALLVAALHP